MPNSNVRAYVKERFGADLDGKFHYNGDYWYCWEPEKRYETNGIRAVRDMDIGLKPTTYFLQLIEDKIEENRVDLSREELEALLTGDMIEHSGLEKGYVALFFKNRCIGCGFYMDELISSRVPEGRGEELLRSI